MKLLLLSLSLLAVTSSACVQQLVIPTTEQLTNPDCGEYPSDVENVVKHYLKQTLFDPYSVMDLEISKPKGCYWQRDAYSTINFGYCFFTSFNAKNRMGGYVGIKKHFVFLRDRIIWIFTDTYAGMVFHYVNCQPREKI